MLGGASTARLRQTPSSGCPSPAGPGDEGEASLLPALPGTRRDASLWGFNTDCAVLGACEVSGGTAHSDGNS